MFEKIGYGLGDAGFNFYWAIIGSYLLYFYTDIFGLAPAAAAWMFGLTRLIDALTDPAMGFIADRTQTRWGKFRPYLLFGALPMAGAAILTMSTPDLGDTGKLIWAYGTYSAMMLAYTVLSTPYSSLAGVLTADSNERNSIFGIRFFFAYFTGIIVGAATPDLAAWFGGGDEAKGWQLTMALYASVATILFWISFATTRERVQPPKAQQSSVGQDLMDLINNRPWLILFALAMIIMITIVLRGSSSAYYFKYFVERPDLMGLYIGLQMAAYAVGALSAPLLVRYIEKAKLLMVLMSIVGVLCIAYTFVPKPEANGVVTITVDEIVTLSADKLLGDSHQTGDQYRWTEDDKIFWIFKDRITLDTGLNATGGQIKLTNAKNKVISVIKTRTGPDGTVITDSSDLPIEIIIMFILNILISLALGPKSPVTWSMYADAADFNEWKNGRRATAMTFSAATFSQKLGGTVASIAIASVLASIGYSANQVQTGASQTGIVMLQTLVPGLFAFVALIALKFYDLSDEKLRQIQLDLQEREQ
ncbi:MAG: MFS transporter [Alteromonadaceae bacterium]|nr:MAG: MFS transporter [Alteromonadaceae bacterium]